MAHQKINAPIKKVSKLEKSLKGLAEIFKLTRDKDDYFYLAAKDNLESLCEIIPELIKSSNNSKQEIIDKLKEISFTQQIKTSENTEITK